jgi:hypothetical protein
MAEAESVERIRKVLHEAAEQYQALADSLYRPDKPAHLIR